MHTTTGPADHRGPVIAAVDGSPAADRAAAWAAAWAARHRRPLTLLYVNDWPGYGTPTWPLHTEWEVAEGRAVGAEILAASRRTLEYRGAARGLAVTTETVDGSPAAVLVERAAEASLVVLGRRGRGGFGELLLGATAHQVAQHAPAPVVVVPEVEVEPAPDGPGVVLGVDIGETFEPAAAFAFEEAARLGLPLTAVRGWTMVTEQPGLRVVAPHPEELEREQRRLVGEALAGWCEKYPDVPVRVRLVRRHAARSLVQQARGADLLVVGARGSGGFPHLRLGSVSDAAVRHAPCPVVVAR